MGSSSPEIVDLVAGLLEGRPKPRIKPRALDPENFDDGTMVGPMMLTNAVGVFRFDEADRKFLVISFNLGRFSLMSLAFLTLSEVSLSLSSPLYLNKKI